MIYTVIQYMFLLMYYTLVYLIDYHVYLHHLNFSISISPFWYPPLLFSWDSSEFLGSALVFIFTLLVLSFCNPLLRAIFKKTDRLSHTGLRRGSPNLQLPRQHLDGPTGVFEALGTFWKGGLPKMNINKCEFFLLFYATITI